MAPLTCSSLTDRYSSKTSRERWPLTVWMIRRGTPLLLKVVNAVLLNEWVLAPSKPIRSIASLNILEAESGRMWPLPWRPGNRNHWYEGGLYSVSNALKSSPMGIHRVASLPLVLPLLRSCTWKYGCQNHNYVQAESNARHQVKKETQGFAGK